MGLPLVLLKRRRGGGSPAFYPVSLFTGTDTGWVYDLSDMSTLFQDAAGTTPVTAVGQPVGRCLDLSGKGNHRTQSTALNRPTYARHPLGGIRNLLTRTEEFNDAVWTKTGGGTVSANTATAPNGTVTADKFTPSVSSAFHSLRQTLVTTSATQTHSTYVKADGYGFAAITIASNIGYSSSYQVLVNLSTGAVANTSITTYIGSHSVTSVGDGWYRVSISITNGTIASGVVADVYPYSSAAQFGTQWTADGTSGILVWGSQFEQSASATAYQRVGSAFDVTEAGVEDLYYLSYDGINDSLATASFAWGTDKATVVAGVRKLSDTARGTVVEHTASIASNNGGFHLTAPNAASATFAFESKGTSLTDAVASSVAAPTTRVLTGIGDIAGDNATIRLDGSVIDTDTGDQGSGDYASAVNHFGARAGTSLFFNGREYSNVGINRLLTSGELAALESWAAGKAGITL